MSQHCLNKVIACHWDKILGKGFHVIKDNCEIGAITEKRILYEGEGLLPGVCLIFVRSSMCI